MFPLKSCMSKTNLTTELLVKRVQETPKIKQAAAPVLALLAEPGGKTLLLKSPHTSDRTWKN